MTTMLTAEKNIRDAERVERRRRVEAEARRLDVAREAEANTKRVARLAAERDKRMADAIETASVVEFTVSDYRVRVSLGHESLVARTSARAACIALAHLLTALEYERLEAARIGGVGPDVARRLSLVLDADGCRQAAAFGVLVAEQK